MFDFSPLKSRGLRVLLVASASGALGIYAPIFYLVSPDRLLFLSLPNRIFALQVYQGYKEGLEDSALVLLQTFLGFASALGCVGFGLVTVRPSSQCLISRQYLCQAAMIGIGKRTHHLETPTTIPASYSLRTTAMYRKRPCAVPCCHTLLRAS